MQIKLEKFEGPLGLLLKIIEKEELDITQISLSKIADEYVTYIRDPNNNIQPEAMADFLVVAAKLLLIKSRALLPYLQPEEEAEIEELEQQLKMYKEFLEATKKIEKMIGKKKFMFAREFNRKAILNNMKIFSPPAGVGPKELSAVFTDLLSRLQPPEKLEEEVLERKIHIEEKIMHIQQILVDRISVSFSQVLSKACSKTEIIVSFLALLELMKQRSVSVDQTGLFAEIIIGNYQNNELSSII